VSDATSIQNYLTHTFEASEILLQTDTEALDYAGWILRQQKDPEQRFVSATVQPQFPGKEDLLFPQVLGRLFGDRITVRNRPPGAGTVEQDVFIRGISHEITESNWTTKWVFEAAPTFSFLVLDNAILGQLGNNSLAY
jgi:hypothetical protein